MEVKLFFGLQIFENDDEKHHHELLRHSGIMKNIKVELTMKRIWKILEKDIWLMKENESLGRNNMFEGDLDAKEQRDNELIKEHLNGAPR